MTKAEQREVIIETLQQELIERFNDNIMNYQDSFTSGFSQKEVDEFEKKIDELDEMDLYNYLEDLIENKLDFLIEKYGLVVVDDELDFDLVEPIYTEYIEKFINGELDESEFEDIEEVFTERLIKSKIIV
jgi:hypothetical protein